MSYIFIQQPYPKRKLQVHLKYLPGRSGGREREQGLRTKQKCPWTDHFHSTRPILPAFLCNLLAVTVIALQVRGAVGADSFYFLPGAWNTKSIQQVCLVLFWFLGMKHNHCFPDLRLKGGLKTCFSQKVWRKQRCKWGKSHSSATIQRKAILIFV